MGSTKYPFYIKSTVILFGLVVLTYMLSTLQGISGMFLSIPATGILKIIFDRVDELKPWGKLLGYEVQIKRRNFSIRKK